MIDADLWPPHMYSCKCTYMDMYTDVHTHAGNGVLGSTTDKIPLKFNILGFQVTALSP